MVFDGVKIKLYMCFLTEHHDLEAYCGSGGTAPRVPDFGIGWNWVVSFTPRPLYPQGKSPGTHLIPQKMYWSLLVTLQLRSIFTSDPKFQYDVYQFCRSTLRNILCTTDPSIGQVSSTLMRCHNGYPNRSAQPYKTTAEITLK